MVRPGRRGDPGLGQALAHRDAHVLAARVRVVDQVTALARTGQAARPQGVLERVEHERRRHPRRGPPADDPAGEHVDDEGHVHHARPGRDVREVGNPQPVRVGRPELSFHMVIRSRRAIGRSRFELAAPHRSLPALPAEQPLDRAPGHIDAFAAQVKTHFAGPEPGDHRVLGPLGDHDVHQVPVADLSPRHATAPVLVVGTRGDLAPVLGQHGADRLDPEPFPVGVDERD